MPPVCSEIVGELLGCDEDKLIVETTDGTTEEVMCLKHIQERAMNSIMEKIALFLENGVAVRFEGCEEGEESNMSDEKNEEDKVCEEGEESNMSDEKNEEDSVVEDDGAKNEAEEQDECADNDGETVDDWKEEDDEMDESKLLGVEGEEEAGDLGGGGEGAGVGGVEGVSVGGKAKNKKKKRGKKNKDQGGK